MCDLRKIQEGIGADKAVVLFTGATALSGVQEGFRHLPTEGVLLSPFFSIKGKALSEGGKGPLL